MKSLICSLAFVLSLILVTPYQAIAKMQLVASTPALGQIAEAVGGDNIEVLVLARVGQDAHFVPPKPTLARHLADADVVLFTGLDLEIGWLPRLIDASRNPAIRPGRPGYIDGSQFLPQVVGKPSGLVTRAMGDVHPDGNPHWWLDPLSGAAVASGLANRFASLDPSKAGVYRKNAADFTAMIKKRMLTWRAVLHGIGPVVTYHDSFRYFVERFEIQVLGYIEPKPGVEPSTAHLDELIRHMRQDRVHSLWVEPYHNTRTARRVAELSGARLLILPDSVEGHGAAGYLGMFDVIADTLKGVMR